ncbi:hypothetical protein O0L34_g4456 [Tuta absoluta]|nr:hypothetical protein O0L34_g16746 [Tuta absoluta]KAJ2952177.1 hypothetical protein O0L34_g4456 [Tuta absoluta]
MASSAKKSRILQRFNRQWMEEPGFSAWLQPSQKGDTFAFCKFCQTDLSVGSAGKNDIFRHSKTGKHIDSSPSTSSNNKQTTMSKYVHKVDSTKRADILLASFVAEHNLSMNIMEHLPQLIQKVCPDSDIAKGIKCGRTKVTKVLTSVTGATDKDNILSHIRNHKFSLLVDESTDRGCTKHLCLVVRYYKDFTVTDAFLCLVPIQDGTAEALYLHIVKYFADNYVPYKDNMIGFAADGASTMMGQHNSLASRFLADIPNLFVMKCICHTFHLCASYACAKLAREPEGLVRDIYNYFNNSPKRAGILKEFQEFLDLKPHKILHPCQTRWLSLRPAVTRLLEQYEALKLYFTEHSFTDRLQTSDNILCMLKNPYNKIYLEFLEYALEIFNNMNRLMQSQRPEVHKLHENMKTAFRTLLDNYIDSSYLMSTELQEVQIDNPRRYLPIEQIYLGTKVATSIVTSTNLEPEHIKNFQLRCLEFYIEGARQIRNRYNFNNKKIEDLQFLDPDVIKSRKITSLVHVALHFPNLIATNDVQDLDLEWRHLRNNLALHPEGTNEDMERYWSKILQQVKPSDGTPLYPELSRLISDLLCLPHSSAAVERIFSSINLIKTKQRNRLETSSIEGLLHTKQLLNNKPCYDLNVDSTLLSKMNKDIYS